MSQQAVQAQRGPEAQRGVDLRLSRLPHELHREQQQSARDQARFAIPQAARQVVDQQRRMPRALNSEGRRKDTRSESVSWKPSAISQKNSGGLSA